MTRQFDGRGDGGHAERVLAPESHQRTLTLRIKSFITEHLHNPDLNPRVIAAAHHISVSYLHRLFQADGVTASAWIRRQRLERARRDLADPKLRTVRVHRIAAHWGFTHHAAFTRAFRTAYGIPPREYRHQHSTFPAWTQCSPPTTPDHAAHSLSPRRPPHGVALDRIWIRRQNPAHASPRRDREV